MDKNQPLLANTSPDSISPALVVPHPATPRCCHVLMSFMKDKQMGIFSLLNSVGDLSRIRAISFFMLILSKVSWRISLSGPCSSSRRLRSSPSTTTVRSRGLKNRQSVDKRLCYKGWYLLRGRVVLSKLQSRLAKNSAEIYPHSWAKLIFRERGTEAEADYK